MILFAAIVALYVFYEETKKRVREYQRAYDRGMLARIEAGDPSVRIMTAGGANGIALSQHRDHQHLHLVHLPDGPSGQSGGRMDGSSGGHELALPSGLNGHMHGGASIGSGSGSSGDGGVHGHQASGGEAIGSDSVGGGGGAGGHASSGHSGSGGHHALYGMGALAHGGGGSGLLPVLPPMPAPIPTWRLRMLPFSYASISAIIGTQSVLLAKSMAELLRTTADGRQQFSAYFTWVILAAWLSSMLFWMYRMTTALRKFDKEPLIIPVLQVVWTIFSIVGGGIYFQEFMEMSAVAIALFVIGVLMLLAGVYLLTPESHSDPSETLHLHHGMHLVPSSQLSNHMHLSDVELQNLDGHSQHHTHSPYGLRQAVGMGGSAGDLGLGDGIIGLGGNAASTVNSVSPPGAGGAQMHFRDSHSHSHHGGAAEKGSHSSHSSSRSGSLSKGEHGLRPSGSSNSIGGGSGSASAIGGGGQGGGSGPSDDAVLLAAPPPGKITRVTSTGRIQIQSAPLDSDEHDRDHYVVEVSPEFRPFESALSSGGAAASLSSAGASTAATAASSGGSTRAVTAHKLHPPPAFDASHVDSHDDGDEDDDRHGRGAAGISRTASIDEELRLPASSSSSSLGLRGGVGLGMGGAAATSAHHAAAASSSAAASAAAPGPPAQSMGILSEAGLLGSGAGSSHHHHQGRHQHHGTSPHRSAVAASRLHTPPLHPAAAFSASQWGTPVRGPHPSHLDSVGSRPPSASGGHHSGSSGGVLLGDHHHSSSTHNSGSIPPSPALYGYDIYASLRNDGAVKRGRGMSLGFSMPMIDMDLGEEQK